MNTVALPRTALAFRALGSDRVVIACLALLALLLVLDTPQLGASLEFMLGLKARAPRIFQRLGLEWLHRMLTEPRRLGGRYISSVVPLASLWIRELRGSEQKNSIADATPIVVLGDMNAVPNASMAPFETLISGDIADEETFGPDFVIDWDGTDLTDVRPSHNALGREYYTWRNDNMPFAPSALDRVLYTDSVMSVRNRFVLNTMTLPPADLADLGLQQSDVLYDGDPNYYDHLPLVVDFEISSASLSGHEERRAAKPQAFTE